MAMGWEWLFLLLVIVGVVILVVVAIALLASRGSGNALRTQAPPVGNARARQILAERYARGEIERDEYEERLRTLREE